MGVSGNSYDQMTITMLKLPEIGCWLPLDLCAYPKLFTLPAEISNQPNCAKTRCHMQRSVFVYKGVIELFYNPLDVKTQYVCTERAMQMHLTGCKNMRMYTRTPYLSVSVICISVFFSHFHPSHIRRIHDSILSATPIASQSVDKCKLFRCCGETRETLLLNEWLLMCAICGFGYSSDKYCP